jgi:hypothetical protein
MNMPGFTAEASLSELRGHYRSKVGGVQRGDGRRVVPQQFASCTTNRSCWGVVLMCRDHCQRWDGSSFSSNWYACGPCIGLFEEFPEFDF